jgi:hypothetical protein
MIEKARAAFGAGQHERSAGWGRLLIQTLAPQGELPEKFKGDGARPWRAMALLARSARKGNARCVRLESSGGREWGASAAQALGEKWLEWRGQGARLFWSALAKRDAEAMARWTKRAAANGRLHDEIEGLAPLQWALALAVAEELRAQGAPEREEARWSSRLKSGAEKMLAIVSEQAGASGWAQRATAWEGLSAAQMAAFCGAKNACARFAQAAEAAAAQNPQSVREALGALSPGPLECAAKGLARDCMEPLAPAIPFDRSPIDAALAWANANEPAQAAKFMRLRWERASAADNEKEAKRAHSVLLSSKAAQAIAPKEARGAWAELIASLERLALRGELDAATRKTSGADAALQASSGAEAGSGTGLAQAATPEKERSTDWKTEKRAGRRL